MLRILCGNANRTGIQIADTHHDTAHGYQRSSCETILLCTQHCCDDHVTACHHFTIGFNDNLRTQVVLNQCLMGFGQTQFPRQTGIVDRTAGSCTGTAVITGDQDDTCASLGNTGSDCSDTGLRYQLYRDSGLLVGILQIIDQLCQVLNGVDIVVRRRRNQCHTGCGMSCLGNPRIHFLCRKMTALARLCALCHLDLDFLGGSQILGGNTEPSGSHLLDGRALIHSTAGSDNAFQIFTALTAVGLTADSRR